MTRIINSTGFIKHLNIRKVGPEDEKVLALDIKVGGCFVSIEFLARILGTEDPAMVRLASWDSDETYRFLGMGEISATGFIQNCLLDVGGLKLYGVELKKFKATIRDECRVELEFSASVSSPPGNAAPILAEMLSEEVDILVSEAQQGFDFQAAEDEKLLKAAENLHQGAAA